MYGISPARLWMNQLALVTALTICVIFAIPVKAQQVFGSIFGTVSDSSGAAVANAKITVTDLGKGTSSTAITNDSGNYSRGQLIPGTYRVEIEAQGFSKVVSTDITVVVDQAARVDVTLSPGSVTERVDVTATAPLLQSDRADVAQTFTSKDISDLPNFGRNLQSFELLSPGTSEFGWQQNTAENPQGSVMIQVNGQPFSGTGYQLDGTTNQDPILGEILINPPIDSVNDVKQASQDYDAEFGFVSSGNLVYSTKSGSNKLHGSAFEFIYLNTPGFQDFARNPFNSAENSDSTRQVESVRRLHWGAHHQG